MSIISAHAASEQTTTALPPAWATAQLPTDDGALHVGQGRTLDVHAPDGSDAGRLYAALEQVGQGDPAIRLQGAADQPLTLAQAWRQAAILQDLVLHALGATR
jgi:hypothetical protein